MLFMPSPHLPCHGILVKTRQSTLNAKDFLPFRTRKALERQSTKHSKTARSFSWPISDPYPRERSVQSMWHYTEIRSGRPRCPRDSPPNRSWEPSVLDNGNEWRKACRTLLALPASLVCTLFNKGGNRRAFRLPGKGPGSCPLCGGTCDQSYSVSIYVYFVYLFLLLPKNTNLEAPSNRLNAILSLLQPFDRYRTPSAIRSAIGPDFNQIPWNPVKVWLEPG